MVDGFFVDVGIFLTAFIGNGIMDVSVLLLPMGVTFAGMILPLHQVRYSVVMGTSLAIVLTVLHSMGRLPNQPDFYIAPQDFVVFPILVFACQLMMLYTTHRLRKSLYRTQKGKAALEDDLSIGTRWHADR